MNTDKPTRRQLFLAEMSGTGLLLLVGLSSVIFMFAETSPFVALVPSLTLRRAINGFFFGAVGATIALSFVFLAYSAYCMARLTFAARSVARWVMAAATGVFMMALDVVIDPLAVLGEQWFLGRLFTYATPGPYFGVPLSNFVGWVIVGAVGCGVYLGAFSNHSGRRVWPGIALYYAVLGFNLTMTVLIGELLLAVVGATIHVVLALSMWSIWSIHRKPGAGVRPQSRGMQRL